MKKMQKYLLFAIFPIMGLVLAIRYYTIGKETQAWLLLIQYLLLGILVYPLKDSFKDFTKKDWIIKLTIFILYSIVIYLNYRVAVG